jgi:predicted aspartyl protease
MSDDTAKFRTTLGVAALDKPKYRRDLFNVRVDTRSEYNWIPSQVLDELGVTPVRTDRFETPDGRVLERQIGFALVYAGGRSAPSVVVFATREDIVLLGAHGLEGLNLHVDPKQRELVPSGPIPTAVS